MALYPEDIQYQMAHINENRAPEVIVSRFVCLSFAILAVILRFIARRHKAGIGADDWMILVALILATGECSGVFLGTIRYGSAKHAITLKEPDKIAKITLGVQELYTTGIGCAKISVLLMYHRCFPSQRFRICLWAVGTFIAAYSFVQFLVIIFQCTPVRGAWDPSIKASCIHLMLELEIMGILNAITDIITVLLPMPMLWKLQMPLKQKIEVMLTFLVGGFVCIVSVIRVPMEAGISLVDASYTDVTGCIWSFVELSVAVICACLPTYRPLLRWCVRLVKGEPEKPSNEIETPELSSPPWEKGDYSSSTDRSASDV